jgi:hypothetical protein
MLTLTLLTTGSLTTSERHAKLISVDMRDKGGWYMSPFWNHILAKSGRFIHVSLQISWYVRSMYLGTQGDFFSDLYIVLFSHGAVCCFVAVISPTTVPTVLHFASYRTNSNTPFFSLRITACALDTSAPHQHRPSASHMTSYLRSIAPHISIAVIEFTRPHG